MKIFILGGGPSINHMNLDLIKKQKVLGVNAAYKLGSWVDICFFADNRFLKNNMSDLRKWPNRIVSCAPKAFYEPKIEYLKRCPKHAICYEPGKIAFPDTGGNSGASALALAIKEGFDEIILLGFDMQTVNGIHNYHNFHNHVPTEHVYDKFVAHFENIAKELKKVKVYNATPDSKLKCFPKVDYNEVI